MITAPLITQGVKIDLPEAPSEVLPPSDDELVVVTVDVQGQVFIDFGKDPDQPVTDQVLVTRIAALKKHRPQIDVLVEGDRSVDYGRGVRVMTLLQQAGVSSVGLITQPPER